MRNLINYLSYYLKLLYTDDFEKALSKANKHIEYKPVDTTDDDANGLRRNKTVKAANEVPIIPPPPPSTPLGTSISTASLGKYLGVQFSLAVYLRDLLMQL